MSMIQKRSYLLIGFVVLTTLFILLAQNYYDPVLQNIGKDIQSNLYDPFGNFWRDVFVVITYTGSGYVSFPITGLLVIILLYRKQYWMAFLLAYNLIGVRLLNWLIKSLFEVPRPGLEHLVYASYYSFPSGHAMNSTAFIGFLAFLISHQLKMMGKRASSIWAFSGILIFLICLSRVYLGVHYPMDVIGGFLAGGAWLFATLLIVTFIHVEGFFSIK